MQQEYISVSGRARDLRGEVFGRLRVLGCVGKSGRHLVWHCLCECGTYKSIIAGTLLRGGVASCGCLRREGKSNRSHGMSRSRYFNIWQQMKMRCFNPNSGGFPNYGGRGITIYEPWIASFQEWYNYVSRLPYFDEPGRSLDRVDVNLDYEPGNLRWATRREQGANMTTNRHITFEGKTKILVEWAREFGMSASCLGDRLDDGWSFEDAVLTPVQARRKSA